MAEEEEATAQTVIHISELIESAPVSFANSFSHFSSSSFHHSESEDEIIQSLSLTELPSLEESLYQVDKALIQLKPVPNDS